MIEVRPYKQLGGADHGWLKTKHHFSFADYYDPQRTHWGQLRVWNDDSIDPGSGFPAHPHRDMEIITYVYQGAITHTDSLGNQGLTQAGDVQIMSAGTGVTHSEYNLQQEVTKLFQIWMMPDKKGHPPTWGTKVFPKADRSGQFTVLASGSPQDSGALPIHSTGRVLAVSLLADQTLEYAVSDYPFVYLVATKGNYTVNEHHICAHDGVAIRDEQRLSIHAQQECEIIMVESK